MALRDRAFLRFDTLTRVAESRRYRHRQCTERLPAILLGAPVALKICQFRGAEAIRLRQRPLIKATTCAA